jgi:hypothetical protein
MAKRIIVALVIALATLATSSPAHAMCTAGYIGVRDGKPVIQMPQCHPYE